MVADLWREDGAGPPARPVLRLLGRVPFRGQLAPGRYRLDAASLGRNDRLDYTLSLATAELQPGVPRAVAPSATVRFALAEAGVVSLTSFGATAVKAVLRDAAGTELGRYGASPESWNLAVSRPLPAGSYRLDLQPAVPPGVTNVPRRDRGPAGGGERDGSGNDAASAEDPANTDAGNPQATSDDAGTASGSADGASHDDASADSVTAGTADAAAKTELTLLLPAAHDPVPAPAGTAQLSGGGVHRLLLPQPAPGTLVLAAASSPTPVVLAMERQQGTAWDTVALDQGTQPVVAVPADSGPAPWRVLVWAVDGGSLPVRASVAVLDPAVQPLGTLAPIPVEGAATPVTVARARLDAATPVRLAGDGLLAGGWPGHPLLPTDDGVAVPQGDTLWLVARGTGTVPAETVRAAPDQAVTVPVPAGGEARLAGPQPPGSTTRIWLAESGLGQPGLDAGQGAGIAPGSALAAGAGPVRIWNAGGDDALRPRVTALDLAVLPFQRLDGPLQAVLPPRSALVLTLPDGERRTDLALSPGVAAILGDTTVWTGATPSARSVPGSATVLSLLNTGTQAAPASVSWTPAAASPPLRPGTVSKRFFGAAGSFDLRVDAPAGARLRVAGDAQALVLGGDGRLRHGGDVLSGPGHLPSPMPPGRWRSGSTWPAPPRGPMPNRGPRRSRHGWRWPAPHWRWPLRRVAPCCCTPAPPRRSS